MEKIKILAIAPYSEMETLIKDVAKKYNDIEVYTYTGYYENAIAFSKSFPDKEYDIVISRGGTAKVIQSMIETPVVEIKISDLDLLRVITQALRCTPKCAVVSYPFITKQVEQLTQFLRLNVQTFSFENANRIAEQVDQCVAQGYELILGGAATEKFALERGVRFMTITSSKESIDDSFQEAIAQYRMMEHSIKKNRLAQTLLDRSAYGTFAFGENRDLLYTNIAGRQMLNQVQPLEQFLISSIEGLKKAGSLHILKEFNHSYFEIGGDICTLGREEYFRFELCLRSAKYHQLPFMQIENLEDIQKQKRELPYCDLYLKPLQDAAQLAAESSLPILVLGEIGTRKGLVVQHIHSKNPSELSTLIRINCSGMTEKNWQTLLNHGNCPLHAAGYSVCFEDVDTLPLELQRQIGDYIEDTQLFRRHRLMSTSHKDLSAEVSRGNFASSLYFQLSGITVSVPSLKQRREDIPALMNLLLPEYNTTFMKSVVGFEPDAMEEFSEFDWPLNMLQLETVLRHLISSASSYYITKKEVTDVLHREMRKSSSAASTFDLTGTLDEIERRIIECVVREENMNQSAAARRLGIGRSTLWRKLTTDQKE